MAAAVVAGRLGSALRRASTAAAGGVVVPLNGSRAVVAVRGVDALTYLQGLVTNDVKTLGGPHAARFGAFLNGKGRTMFEANIVVPAGGAGADGGVLLDTAREHGAALAAYLRRFKLRSKVDIVDLSDSYTVAAVLPPSPLASHAGEAGGDDRAAATLAAARRALLDTAGAAPGAAYYDPRSARLGCRIVVPSAAADAVLSRVGGGAAAGDAAAAAAGYNVVRMLAGVPEGAEVADVIPLEWNLTFLNGVSFHKGCYVGQELVARTHFRGLVRKRYMPVLLAPAATPPRAVAVIDALAAAAGAAAPAAAGPFALPFPGIDTAWRGSVALGTKLTPSTSGSGGSSGSGGGGDEEADTRIGHLVGWARGTNVGLAMVRLQHVSHTLPNGASGDKTELAVAPPADAVPPDVAAAPTSYDPFFDNVTAPATAAALTALHAAAASRTVDFIAAGGGGEPSLRVTPALPPFWRHIAHSGAE